MANGEERDSTASYEEWRTENVRLNTERLHELIPSLAEKSSHEQNNKKTKKRQCTFSQPAIEMPRHQLRSDTARADSRHDDEDMQDCALEENEDVDAATQHGTCLDGGQQQKKKRGRSYTRKPDIRSRGNQPPIRLEINEKGQPVGDNATEFAKFIATLVKNGEIVSLAKPDWRLVEPKQKLLLWNTLKVDERVKDWVMGSAAKKWRDFKSDLKALHFDEEKTDEELLADYDDRVHEDDWKWLIDYWRTDGAKQRSERGKLNRKGMTLFHTTASKSHARVIDEEHKKNGYPPRRDEAFVITHTSTTEVPSKEAAAQKIKELEDEANKHPELLEKTIEQGDLFSHVFGKERNGYVRCIGLGPSAADLRMPGTRKLKSTKLQMAEEECQQAVQDAALLRQRVEGTDRKVDILMNEILEMKRMMLASQAKENEQFTPQYDSNSALNEDIDDEGENSEAGYRAAENQNDHVMSNRPMLENRAEITQQKKQVLVQQKNQLEHQNTTVAQKTPQVGQDVILYSIARPYNIPVAKDTIRSIDRTKIVAGAELGSQCCEVVVNMVMKKDAILQRPYENVRTMANALRRSIAWPRRYMEVVHKVMQRQPSQPVAVPTSRRSPV